MIDLLPTFLDLAGVDSAPKFQPEGESITAMVKGSAGNPDRTFAWEHEGHRGIRKGKWKLVRLHDANGWDLYDITTDRAEQHNVADQHPDVVKELEDAYNAWADRVGVVPWEKIVPHRPEGARK
jgi:arylsulfatase